MKLKMILSNNLLELFITRRYKKDSRRTCRLTLIFWSFCAHAYSVSYCLLQFESCYKIKGYTNHCNVSKCTLKM